MTEYHGGPVESEQMSMANSAREFVEMRFYEGAIECLKRRLVWAAPHGQSIPFKVQYDWLMRNDQQGVIVAKRRASHETKVGSKRMMIFSLVAAIQQKNSYLRGKLDYENSQSWWN